MCLPIARRPDSRRAEFDVSCDSNVQVPGHVRINGMLPSWSIEPMRLTYDCARDPKPQPTRSLWEASGVWFRQGNRQL